MESQRTRHPQVPIVVAQIVALEEAAREASLIAASAPSQDQIGRVLTSNMSAAFALELGLKVFYMGFAPNGAPRTHSLAELYAGLPRQMRGDVDETYRGNLPTALIRTFALMVSPTRPTCPATVSGSGYKDAVHFFDSTDLAFIQSRYFFEQVGGLDWSIVDHPIDHMLHMSSVLRIVYREYVQHGGWSDAHFQP